MCSNQYTSSNYSSNDSSTDACNESVFQYYKPILASEARARTIIGGYHVSLDYLKIFRLYIRK